VRLGQVRCKQYHSSAYRSVPKVEGKLNNDTRNLFLGGELQLQNEQEKYSVYRHCLLQQ
jgi:hypothetical protein